jgi:hypothetical protein
MEKTMTMPITEPPEPKPGAKLCLAVTKQGVTAYGNKGAFEQLAEWLQWIASSDPSEHFECHTILSLQDEASALGKQRKKNVYPLFSKQTKAVFERENEHGFGFELTFMMVEDAELDEFTGFQETGLLPDSWNEEERLVFYPDEKD